MRMIMTKLWENNKKRYLSNEKPPILHVNCRNSDLKLKKQSNMPKLHRTDELGTPLSFFEIYFDYTSVTQIVQLTKPYGQQEKGDCSFEKG